jgi:thiamine biosynthesis lipoprotein
MRLDRDQRTLRLERSGVRLDVGGIAKGFAADRALEVLGDRGITVAMVVAGGEMALGDPPPGRCGWRVGIAPLADETPRTIPLELARAGVSTSGDAEQWMEVDGVRYSHILDPRIGEPLTERVSVTVVAPDAMTSDMLATAVAVLGERDGLALVDEYGSAAVVTTAGGQSQSTRWALDGSGAGRDPCDEHPSEQ